MPTTDPPNPHAGTPTCPNCGAPRQTGREICPRCGAVSRSGQSEYAPGTVIDGKYQVVGLLGVGGMGEVYKTRHLHLNAYRCIKVMRRSLLADETFRTRFIREARVATQVQHPNIAVLHDFSTLENGTYYMVWEFIDGMSLRQWASEHGRFPLDVAVDIALQVLAGLDYCHRRGLLHRDISPDNVLVANDPDDLHVKIIDLGIVKNVASPKVEKTTLAGTYVGNPKYSSPEQLGGVEEGETIDGRTDLYSLGVVLYEMLLGVPPFSSGTPQGYVIKHLTEPPAGFQEIDPHFVGHEALEKIVFCALEKDREKRFASAREFALALRQFQNDRARALGVEPGDTVRSRRAMLAVPELHPTPERTWEEDSDKPADDELAWESARETDTFESYEEFLRKYPTSGRAALAQAKLGKLLLDRISTLENRLDSEALTAIAETYPAGTSPGDAVRAALDRVARGSAALEENAWSNAERAGSAEAWQSFLQRYPRSSRSSTARQRLAESTLFEAAASDDSADAWQQFLAFHPDGPHASDAKQRLHSAIADGEDLQAFEAAKTKGTTEAWESFLERRPDSKRATLAKSALDELIEYQAAKSSDDERIWAAFMRRWSEGPHAAEAATRSEALTKERLAYESAVEAGTSSAIDEFIVANPGGRRITQARELGSAIRSLEAHGGGALDEIDGFLTQHPSSGYAARAKARRAELTVSGAFEEAERKNTADSWRRFIAEVGANDPPLRAKAKSRLDQLADRTYSNAVSEGDLEKLLDFVEQFPDSLRAGEARHRIRMIQAEFDIGAFLSSTVPETAVEPLASLEVNGIGPLIVEAERTGKVEHLAALAKKLENRGLRRSAEEARSRASEVRAKREGESTDWAKAEREDTSQLWQAFIASYPESSRTAEARNRERRALEFEEITSGANTPEELSARLGRTSDDHVRARVSKRISDLQQPPAAAPAVTEVGEMLPLSQVRAEASRGSKSAGSGRPLAAIDTQTVEMETIVLGKVRPDLSAPPAEPAAAPAAGPSMADRALSFAVTHAGEPAQALQTKEVAARPVDQIDIAEAANGIAPAEGQELSFPPSPAIATPAGDASTTRSRRRRTPAIYYVVPVVLGTIVIVLVTAVVAMFRHAGADPASAQPLAAAAMESGSRHSLLTIDARPWGHVTSVRDASGKEWLRQAADTPVAIEVPPGHYAIEISDPKNGPAFHGAADVSGARTAIEAEFRPVDVIQYFREAGWR